MSTCRTSARSRPRVPNCARRCRLRARRCRVHHRLPASRNQVRSHFAYDFITLCIAAHLNGGKIISQAALNVAVRLPITASMGGPPASTPAGKAVVEGARSLLLSFRFKLLDHTAELGKMGMLLSRYTLKRMWFWRCFKLDPLEPMLPGPMWSAALLAIK